jgi:hypothetical protein
MNITSSGAINNPVFPEDLSPELKEHLSATIDQWRFYPLMKQGKIVEQTIAIPLQLRQAPPIYTKGEVPLSFFHAGLAIRFCRISCITAAGGCCWV